MNCKYHSEQLMLYVAGALEADEERAIESHLQEGCSRCAEHLAQGRWVLEALPLALEPQTPRPEARERLLAQLDERIDAEPAPLPLPSAEARRGRRAGWFVRMGSACAAAAALAGGVTFTVMDRQVKQQAGEMAQLRSEVAQHGEQIAEYDHRTLHLEQLADVAGELYATLRSSPLELIQLTGLDEYEDASARLIWDRSRNVGHFVGPAGFQPDDGRRLQLWFVSNEDEALSAGTFSPDEFGWAQFDIGTEMDLSSFESAYISYDDADTPNKALLSGNF